MSDDDPFEALERPTTHRLPTAWTGGRQPPERRRPPIRDDQPDDTIDRHAWADAAALR